MQVRQIVHKTCFTPFWLVTACAALLGGCGPLPASINPQGEAAAQIAVLWWVTFALGTLIWVGFTALLLAGLFRRRRAPEPYVPLPEQEHAQAVRRWVLGAGVAMPTVVLVALVALTVWTLRSIPSANPSGGLVVEVTGHQWWWEVHYPEQGVILQNEVRIPAGQPVEVRLSSADVIHSFWVPELHGKFDLTPGRTHTFVLQAGQPGTYRGRCAEFCGRLHARMTFHVIVMELEEFTAWLSAQHRSIVVPDRP